MVRSCRQQRATQISRNIELWCSSKFQVVDLISQLDLGSRDVSHAFCGHSPLPGQLHPGAHRKSKDIPTVTTPVDCTAAPSLHWWG
jgi:hypothetical protein